MTLVLVLMYQTVCVLILTLISRPPNSDRLLISDNDSSGRISFNPVRLVPVVTRNGRCSTTAESTAFTLYTVLSLGVFTG